MSEMALCVSDKRLTLLEIAYMFSGEMWLF